jgi:hypothetical protein
MDHVITPFLFEVRKAGLSGPCSGRDTGKMLSEMILILNSRQDMLDAEAAFPPLYCYFFQGLSSSLILIGPNF